MHLRHPGSVRVVGDPHAVGAVVRRLRRGRRHRARAGFRGARRGRGGRGGRGGREEDERRSDARPQPAREHGMMMITWRAVGCRVVSHLQFRGAFYKSFSPIVRFQHLIASPFN
eukprot:31423-Pelagococcus_subviridis.AAC.1